MVQRANNVCTFDPIIKFSFHTMLSSADHGVLPDSNSGDIHEDTPTTTDKVETAAPLKKNKHRKEDFELGQLLGGGAFAKVVEGTVINDKSPQFGCKYAVKVMDKRHIMKNGKIKYVCVC